MPFLEFKETVLIGQKVICEGSLNCLNIWYKGWNIFYSFLKKKKFKYHVNSFFIQR